MPRPPKCPPRPAVRRLCWLGSFGEAKPACHTKGLLREGWLRVGYGRLRVPTKPAMHSNSKPAGDSDLKPATLASFAWVFDDDVVWGLEGQAA